MHTLVIIDMQPGFNSWHTPIIKPIYREIDTAKSNNYPIVVLEYNPHVFQETYKKIKRHIGRYDKVFYEVKFEDSGVKNIRRITRSKNIRVCGVNTDCCVFQTVRDLYASFYSVQVIEDACWSCWNKRVSVQNHVFGIEKMQSLSKEHVKIMRK